LITQYEEEELEEKPPAPKPSPKSSPSTLKKKNIQARKDIIDDYKDEIKGKILIPKKINPILQNGSKDNCTILGRKVKFIKHLAMN